MFDDTCRVDSRRLLKRLKFACVWFNAEKGIKSQYIMLELTEFLTLLSSVNMEKTSTLL